MKKVLSILILCLLCASFLYAGTSDSVRTELQDTDEIPVYRPSLGGALGAANPAAYFRAPLNAIIEQVSPADAYLYLRYASDDQGTGFSSTPTASLPYRCELHSTVAITPVIGDCVGRWVNYFGNAAYIYIAYASDDQGTGFSLTPADDLIYIATKVSYTEIPSPDASDFEGLWRTGDIPGQGFENCTPSSGDCGIIQAINTVSYQGYIAAGTCHEWFVNESGTIHHYRQCYGESSATEFGAGGDTIELGPAGVRFTGDGDGGFTILGLGNGSDEDLTFNFDDISNVITITSSSGVTYIDFGAIGISAGYIDAATPYVRTSTDVNIAVSGYSVIYYNNHASPIRYDLPADALTSGSKGKRFCFRNLVAQPITLNPDNADAFHYNTAGAMSAGESLISNGAIGDFMCVQGFTDGTTEYWVTFESNGTWTQETP